MAQATLTSPALTEIVELACRAPSVHNSQPWRWVAEDGVLRLFVEPHRVPHATDHSGREALISCGALLGHLRAAAAAAGWHADIARFPNPNDFHHLATVRFHRSEFVTDADRARADAIGRRRTDRRPFAAPSGWSGFEAVLRTTIDAEQATLVVLPEQARPQLADASRLTESLRRDDPSYQAELRWWTAPSEVSDGIPHQSLLSDADQVGVGRRFPSGDLAAGSSGVERDHSVIVALATYDDSRQCALECGEALSDVLLEATMVELASCTLSHLTELDASRDIVRSLIVDAGEPQLLIRIGRVIGTDQLPPTPRRPVSEVLSIGGGDRHD